MSTDARKSVEIPSGETQTPSGWDPFTVWRERVHKPRTKAPNARPVTGGERPLALLEPIKQGG